MTWKSVETNKKFVNEVLGLNIIAFPRFQVKYIVFFFFEGVVSDTFKKIFLIV